jgi:chromosome segregation ATPase
MATSDNAAKDIPQLINNLNKTNINQNNNLKNLYQSIGTRVSRLREINENYEKKISEQGSELKELEETIRQKEKLLEEIRFHKGNLTRGFKDEQLNELKEKDTIKFYNKEKVNTSTKESEEFFNRQYNEMLNNKDFVMKINENHIQNDPSLKKIYIEKEREVSDLQNKLNSIVKKTDTVKKEIDALRLENHKNSTNLQDLLQKKQAQTDEMDRISEEANKYLKEKGNVNKELIELNEKIDNQKMTYENKMKELNKMIDNTKKMKEFHETLAIEKFSKTSNNFRKNNLMSDYDSTKKSINIIQEETQILEDLENQLKNKKKYSVYLNFNRFILLKKQNQLKEVIKKVRNQTGIENLDKLSEYLELSSKTNKLFENDLKNLNEQKKEIEVKIDQMKKEIQSTQDKVNDTSTKKFEYIDSLKVELEQEEKNKES